MTETDERRGLVPLHIDGMTCDPPCEDGPCGRTVEDRSCDSTANRVVTRARIHFGESEQRKVTACDLICAVRVLLESRGVDITRCVIEVDEEDRGPCDLPGCRCSRSPA